MKNKKGSYRVEGLMKISHSLEVEAEVEIDEALEDILYEDFDNGTPEVHEDPYFDLHTFDGPF